MPFDLLALVDKDETLATCQCFNAEVCYGSGLQYCATEASASVKSAVDDFLFDNDLVAYFLGICQEFALTSLASATRSSTSASPCQCLFSARAARASSVC